MNVSTRHIALTASMALAAGLTIGAATAAHASDGANESSVAFVQTNLDSNIAGRAKVTDSHLANAWGLAFPPGGPMGRCFRRLNTESRLRNDCR